MRRKHRNVPWSTGSSLPPPSPVTERALILLDQHGPALLSMARLMTGDPERAMSLAARTIAAASIQNDEADAITTRRVLATSFFRAYNDIPVVIAVTAREQRVSATWPPNR